MEDIKQVSYFPKGAIKMPPSKSISHRAVICNRLAVGFGVIQNLASSEDIDATIRCMKGLKTAEALTEPLDCGESGSTLRFLIPVAAALGKEVSFTGRGRLMERPLGPYFETLAEHGVKLALNNDVMTVSGQLRSGSFHMPGNISSQFVSGLLLALPLLADDSEIFITTPLESASYVDLTIDVMKRFGVTVHNEGYQRFAIKGGQKYRAHTFTVEGDYSQAAFFLVSGALGRPCECLGLPPSSKQGDSRIVDILKKSGVKIILSEEGGLIATPGKLNAQTVDVSDIPDLVPPLAVFFSFCEGESRIVNAGRLRLKESDRLTTVTEELNKLEANIVMGDDFLTIHGVKTLRGGRMNARGDHRIAMMGAVAAIKSETPVWIEGSNCVAKSYPDFWKDFEKEEKGNE